MSDRFDVLERFAPMFEAPEPSFERFLHTRDRKRRNQRIAAGALGIAVAIAIVVGGVGLIRSSAPTTIPAGEGQPTEPTGTTTGETTGTSTGPCFDSQDGPPPWVCLGPLDEGTYTSQRFEPALTFTVPAGWNNPWDTRGAFTLWTPGWSPGNTLFMEPGLHVRRDPRPEGGCVDATVGTSAIELATLVANHPAIAAGHRRPWRSAGSRATSSTCRSRTRARELSGGPGAVWLFADLYLRDPDKYREFATMRLILLDLPDGGSVLIAIDEDRLDVAMPVVDSFVFDLG